MMNISYAVCMPTQLDKMHLLAGPHLELVLCSSKWPCDPLFQFGRYEESNLICSFTG